LKRKIQTRQALFEPCNQVTGKDEETAGGTTMASMVRTAAGAAT
jgi:hypothetical protein